MPQRLGYKKSRAGCVQCKKRRVKCDETKPSCTACLRHGQRCSFMSGSPSKSPASSAETHTPHSKSDSVEEKEILDSRFYDLDDLLLLHHFTTETSLTFSNSISIRDTWMKVVPILSSGAEYVMRALLAVSALHKVSLDPINNDHLNAVAIRHLNEALALSRVFMTDISKENHESVIAFSTLISIFSFTHPLYYSDDETSPLPVDQLLGAVHMFSGSKSVIAQGWMPVEESPIRPILQWRVDENDRNIPPGIKTHLRWLRGELNALEDQTLFSVCNESMQQLEKIFALVTSAAPDLEMGLVLRWPAMMTPEYMNLLEQRSAPALAILAFFCAMLLEAPGGWVMGRPGQSWKHRLRSEIEGLLSETYGREPLATTLSQLDNEFMALFPRPK